MSMAYTVPHLMREICRKDQVRAILAAVIMLLEEVRFQKVQGMLLIQASAGCWEADARSVSYPRDSVPEP